MAYSLQSRRQIAPNLFRSLSDVGTDIVKHFGYSSEHLEGRIASMSDKELRLCMLASLVAHVRRFADVLDEAADDFLDVAEDFLETPKPSAVRTAPYPPQTPSAPVTLKQYIEREKPRSANPIKESPKSTPNVGATAKLITTNGAESLSTRARKALEAKGIKTETAIPPNFKETEAMFIGKNCGPKTIKEIFDWASAQRHQKHPNMSDDRLADVEGKLDAGLGNAQ